MIAQYLYSIGVMTGNSLDGVDALLCKIHDDGRIEDLDSYSVPNPEKLAAALRSLRQEVVYCQGNVGGAEKLFNEKYAVQHGDVEKVHKEYLQTVSDCINQLTAKNKIMPDIIGFHGQTCAHNPPSIAGGKDKSKLYTIQFGNGQELADACNTTVIYDFRSDDIFAGGEGAPLAAVHHEHLAAQLKARGFFPIAFCNAGNTGNATVVSFYKSDLKAATIAWDAGPFNHFADLLMRSEKQKEMDFDGRIGEGGKVNLELLQALFEKSSAGKESNFITQPLPKSSDPQWYRFIDELKNTRLSFEDRLRTAEYFAAYVLCYSFSLLSEDLEFPRFFALSGGGWKNKVIYRHFVALLGGDREISPLLPGHEEVFAGLNRRAVNFKAELSSFYGFDGQYMEARIFADAAACRVKGIPFTKPETTGAERECVLGIIRFPKGNVSNCTKPLRTLIEKQSSLNLTLDKPEIFNPRWSRASAGWSSLIDS